jgi:DNA repair exonuclease SbcCD ATPase subunit
MEKEIKDLLENEVLGEDVKTALQEAFNNKVKAAEQKLQEDYAVRYSNDKAKLVEAIDAMLTDSIRAELNEFAEDRSALIRQRAKFSKATVEAKHVYKQKMVEHAKMLNSFIAKQLKAELAEFVDDRKSLTQQRQEMAKELQTVRENAKREVSDRINKLEGFVLKQLSEEIAEFNADKKALIEQRIKLAQEGKKKITETQQKFINRATTAVDKTLNEVIRSELVQWRDDIKVARENNFGRRIFEAVAAEYMASYLSEGSEVKKLDRQLQEQKNELEKVSKQLKEQNSLLESANGKLKSAQDRILREETLKELLSPLARDKKAVMEDMLKDIKTQNLKEAFSRYLPAIVNGSTQGSQTKVNLAETSQPKSVAVTGDRNNNKLAQAVLEENQTEFEGLGQLLHLAGLKK